MSNYANRHRINKTSIMNSHTSPTSPEPASPKGIVPLAISALLIAQALPLNPALAQVIQANSAEICTSPSFGGTPRKKLSDYDKCAGAPAAAFAAGLIQKEIFWVPTAQQQNTVTRLCSTPGRLSATLPKGIKIFTLVNINPSRTLKATGTADADVLIGSAGSSDQLSGGGGLDTYVVGGLQASLTVQTPDTVFPSSTVLEQDDVTFGGSTEYIHINPGSDGQNNPGVIQTPLSSAPTITPRGGSAVLHSQRPSATSCQAFLSPWRDFNMAYRTSLASLPTGLSGEHADIPASLLAQPLEPVLDPRNPLNGSGGSRCSGPICRINPNDFTPKARTSQGFPGAPTLRGFNIGSPVADQIFVPSRNLIFEGRPFNVAFPPGKEIPVLVVSEGVRFESARLLKQSQIRALQRRSKGLLSVNNRGIPLVYFRDNGLLVISQSDAPLGTTANPGVVVARLLDNSNKPLALPAGNDGIYLSRFLTFTASPTTIHGGSGGNDNIR